MPSLQDSNMTSDAAPNLSPIASKFEAIAGILVVLIPLVAMNLNLCVFHFGLIEELRVFKRLIHNGIVSRAQICTFEELIVIYAIFVFVGCCFIREELCVYAIEVQVRRNVLNPGVGKLFLSILALSAFFVIVLMVANSIPERIHGDRLFEIKNSFLIMMMMCGEVFFLGHALIYGSKVLVAKRETH
jgi:hypothetical protein